MRNCFIQNLAFSLLSETRKLQKNHRRQGDRRMTAHASAQERRREVGEKVTIKYKKRGRERARHTHRERETHTEKGRESQGQEEGAREKV